MNSQFFIGVVITFLSFIIIPPIVEWYIMGSRKDWKEKKEKKKQAHISANKIKIQIPDYEIVDIKIILKSKKMEAEKIFLCKERNQLVDYNDDCMCCHNQYKCKELKKIQYSTSSTAKAIIIFSIIIIIMFIIFWI